jgi:hypothetical protein
MVWTCLMDRGEDKGIQIFGGKTLRKESIWKTLVWIGRQY